MANRLKIYACSGIGDAAPKSSGIYNYWTDNTNTLYNTQAVNSLLAKINMYVIEVERLRLNDGEVLDRLDAIDLLVVCLDAAQNYVDNLEKAGRVIGTMQAQGQFVCESLDNDERDKHLDELLGWFEDAMFQNGQYVLASDEFLNWWNENVIKLNKVGLSAEQQAVVQKALDSSNISGVGDLDWRDNKELSEYLLNGGTYFLYTYFTDAQLKRMPNENRRRCTIKKAQQNKTYNYCKTLFVGVYGKEETMKEVIRSGIVDRFGVQPEEVCEDLVTGKRTFESIGQLGIVTILSLIATIVGLIIKLIQKILDFVAKSNAEKNSAVTKEEVEKSCPNPEDYEGMYDDQLKKIYENTKKADGEKSGISWLPLIAVAVGILIFGKKFK